MGTKLNVTLAASMILTGSCGEAAEDEFSLMLPTEQAVETIIDPDFYDLGHLAGSFACNGVDVVSVPNAETGENELRLDLSNIPEEYRFNFRDSTLTTLFLYAADTGDTSSDGWLPEYTRAREAFAADIDANCASEAASAEQILLEAQ